MILRCALTAAAALWTVFAAAGESESTAALLHLLNARGSGSPRRYAEAMAVVAQDAARGGVVQRFLQAVLSDAADTPRFARLPEDTRRSYLESARPRILEMAEKRRNPLAWYLLALQSNDEQALRRAAELGNVQALNSLGLRLLESRPRDAFECFCRAADVRDANGLYNLGVCLLNGIGCKRDEVAAFERFKYAADQDQPEAMNNLGIFFREGVVVPKDAVEATKFFRRSAESGCITGQLNFSIALLRGEGIAANEPLAVRMLMAIAKRGNAEAMDALAHCCEKGLGGMPCDVNEALRWTFRAKAARGDRHAAEWLQATGEDKR